MTRTEFESIQTDTPLPIVLLDGAIGLCCHWSDVGIQADVYEGGSGVVTVPWRNVVKTRDGCLIATVASGTPKGGQ